MPDPGEPFVPEQRQQSVPAEVLVSRPYGVWHPVGEGLEVSIRSCDDVGTIRVRSTRRDVDRSDVEQAIVAVLHAQYCDGATYTSDPSVAVADAEGHVWDARLIYDELQGRGWKVVPDA